MSTNPLAPITLIAALLGGGCAEDIPDNPTWNGEIELMLQANCARCHGEARTLGQGRRYDTYEIAFEHRLEILGRAVNYEESGVGQMPPDSYLSNDQKEILGIWIENGAPLGDQE